MEPALVINNCSVPSNKYTEIYLHQSKIFLKYTIHNVRCYMYVISHIPAIINNKCINPRNEDSQTRNAKFFQVTFQC